MTCQEAVEQALARAATYGVHYNHSWAVLFRRLGVRQQQLYAHAARMNEHWAGTCATGTLDADGRIDLADLVDPIYAAERILRVEVADAGTSSYAAGDEVHMVRVDEPDVAETPRVAIRNRITEPIGTDLDGVTSLKFYYARLPLALDETDSATDLELPEPHQELLVVDLAKYLVRKSADLDAGGKQPVLAELKEEEAELLAEFDAYVASFDAMTEERY